MLLKMHKMPQKFVGIFELGESREQNDGLKRGHQKITAVSRLQVALNLKLSF